MALEKYPLCSKLAEVWNNCGWAEAMPLMIRQEAQRRYEQQGVNFREVAEPWLENHPEFFNWLKEFPQRYPEKAQQLSQSLV